MIGVFRSHNVFLFLLVPMVLLMPMLMLMLMLVVGMDGGDEW